MEKMLSGFNKIKLGILNRLSDSGEAVLEETSFYDKGYMQSKINRLKKEMASVSEQLEVSMSGGDSSLEAKEQRVQLVERERELVFQMIFYLSNSFRNLDNCLLLAEGYEFEFMECIRALLSYRNGDHRAAFLGLHSFLEKNQKVDDHYLINKVYGLLLLEAGEYSKAAPYFSYAHMYMPGDQECLTGLITCYKKLGNTSRAAFFSSMLAMVEE